MRSEMNRPDGYNLKLKPKKLSSGRCQVRFEVQTGKSGATPIYNAAYGYYLAEPGATLKEVVEAIQQKLGDAEDKDRLYHDNLYHLQRKSAPHTDFILFTS
ncbi:hypothetical protein AB9P05_17390 [Roseivirga sp. BDSF3-8]|uniref:hypothetical protein n=1 Tax=Roseivirga sp. BDSF3-8 TaxID=3241598 RepID=UPI0035320E52